MELLKKNLALVGTVSKNKRLIPLEFLAHKEREENSSIFWFKEKCTLVSYVLRKNKAVLLLSTMHHTNDFVVEDSRKPEIIKFYNETKGGLDSLDQLVHAYMSKRRSNGVFFSICSMLSEWLRLLSGCRCIQDGWQQFGTNDVCFCWNSQSSWFAEEISSIRRNFSFAKTVLRLN